MSSDFFEHLGLEELQTLNKVAICNASGGMMKLKGQTKLDFKLGNQGYNHPFIVCANLRRPLILGLDFLQINRIGLDWDETGNKVLKQGRQILIESIDEQEPSTLIKNAKSVKIPERSIAVIETAIETKSLRLGQYYETKICPYLHDEYPNLIMPLIIHHNNSWNGEQGKVYVPLLIINLDYQELYLPKGKVVGTLQEEQLDLNEIIHEELDITENKIKTKTREETPSVSYYKKVLEQEEDKETLNKMIVSPADINIHRKLELKDAEVEEKYWKIFKDLCLEYKDIFSTDSADIGHTTLITMEIDTGDSPPICQRPYNLPLKHTEWVRKELELLEKAGVIVRSMSPWASPIVIVPKHTAVGEPPRRRMCVDYRALNNLLPLVKKAYSKAKGVLSLVPLPKIDEIYSKLAGSHIYSSLDLRSGYHHISLSEQSQPKSAFVTPMGKYQFTKVPFGLAQAPAYFQQLINRVLYDMPYTFGYLDDILIYSRDVQGHIEHLKSVFQRMREVGLKLKESKCNFLKQHLQYLGHLISGEGIKPVSEKLDSMEKIASPKNPKQVKQFLGLVGYYRKFVPRFSDIARPLTNLTRKTQKFEWTEPCQKAFKALQRELMKEPILKYPDVNKPYIMFTDASKYAWACVLTQSHEHEIEGKKVVINHPITYQSGLFRGSQLNWAALTKEAYAIYMACKKLVFYLQDADVTIYTDHRPLLKFLNKATLNQKVNNWAMELEGLGKIKIEHIAGIKNTLADTLSRLIETDPEIALEPEPYGQEYGYALFEDLPPIIALLELGGYDWHSHDLNSLLPTDDDELHLPIQEEQLQEYQQQDQWTKQLYDKIKKDPKLSTSHYVIENGVLKRKIVDYKQNYQVWVLPKPLRPIVLKMAHDDLGHNGSTRTYTAIKRLYYWKGMKQDINRYVKQCRVCQQRNKQIMKYAVLHFDTPTLPMEFISMDLIGEFHPPSSKGHRYALTVICMLTGYVFCIPLKTKTAAEVVQKYIHNVSAPYGPSRKILSDNGTEFKNTLFEQIAQEIGVEHKIYSPPYHPQSNGRIEGFHAWLKACMAKHISPQVEWDDVIPLACACYNYFPNENSKESPFFLMFGRDPLLPLNNLIQPKLRYMGDDENILSLEAMKNIYEMAARNLKMARERYDSTQKGSIRTQIKPNDTVMVKNHTAGPFDPKYVGDYRVISVKGNQLEVRPTRGGKTQMVHVSHAKYVLPADLIIQQIPDIKQFGRRSKYRLSEEKIEDLKWELQTKGPKELPNQLKGTKKS